jgi:SAM-dependent methyltransferase
MPGWYFRTLCWVAVPEPLLQRARTSLALRALDARDRSLARLGRGPASDGLVPPRRRDFVGPSDFVATGDEFLQHFTGIAGLTAGERVLDIGCGIGRMARPLTRLLDGDGSYDGFDVNAEGIAWCRANYGAHPRFRFVAVDLFNRRYNPGGARSATDVAFPYGDGAFDLAIATSVFTHLLADEADHYLAEAARTLAPGGRLLSTWFLLDEHSRAAITAGRAALGFRDPDRELAVVDDEMPEEAVAHGRQWLDTALERHGLRLVSLHPGTWRGEEDGASFQDLVLATTT